MLLPIKLLIDAILGGLNALGGFHWLWMRRYIMPIMIGFAIALITHVWWLLFLTWPTIATLSIGYSKDGNFGRSIWIGLQCFVLGLGLFLTHHLQWYFYLPYIAGGCVFGGLYRNWPQVLGDLITGFYMGLIILLVR